MFLNSMRVEASLYLYCYLVFFSTKWAALKSVTSLPKKCFACDPSATESIPLEPEVKPELECKNANEDIVMCKQLNVTKVDFHETKLHREFAAI